VVVLARDLAGAGLARRVRHGEPKLAGVLGKQRLEEGRLAGAAGAADDEGLGLVRRSERSERKAAQAAQATSSPG
jgi:hypothetical protein